MVINSLQLWAGCSSGDEFCRVFMSVNLYATCVPRGYWYDANRRLSKTDSSSR